MGMRRIACMMMFLGLAASYNVSYAQDDYVQEDDDQYYDDIKPKHSFAFQVGLPISTTNKPFSRFMDGIVDANLEYKYSFKNNFSVGLGATYSRFNIDRYRLNKVITGGQNNLGANLRFGYEKFHSMRFATDYSLSIGGVNSLFSSDTLSARGINSIDKKSIMIRPSAAVVLTVSEWAAFRFFASYTFLTQSFLLTDIGATSNEGYKDSDFTGKMNYFTVGFSYIYYFKQY